MVRPKLRIALDANILVAGILFPRWPHEVMRAVLRPEFEVVLPAQVIEEARRHLLSWEQREALDYFLSSVRCIEYPMPSPQSVLTNLGLVRSAKDVPIALALLEAEVEVFVSLDRDFTDPDATSDELRQRLRIMLPAVFLRSLMGWTSDELESIRNRRWNEL